MAGKRRGRPSKHDKHTLECYRADMRAARRWRDGRDLDDTWKRLKDMYAGKQWVGTAREDRIVVNKAFANINIVTAAISSSYPKFVVKPRTPESAATAIIAEEVLNYVWQHYKFQDEFKLAVNDMVQLGHGWLKVGWKAVKAAEVEKPAESDDEAVNVEKEDGPTSEAQAVKFTEDRPFVERVSPWDVYVDPTARTLREARWIAQRIFRPVKEVRANEQYDKAAREAAVPTAYAKYDDQSDRVPMPEDPDVSNDGFVEIIEFYDVFRRSMCVFAKDGGDRFLVAPKKQPFSFGHPFVMFRDYEVVDEFYPMGELQAIEDLQNELNETRTQMINHRKRYARKYLYDPSMFDPEGLSALKSDRDNELVPVQANGNDLLSAITPMPTVMVPPEFYNHSALITDDIDQISGVSDYQRGSLPEIRRTATEAAIIQDSMNARSSDKLARIESTLALVGERVIQLMQQFMTDEQVARVVKDTSQPVWIKYDRDYIQGSFDFEVVAGSTQPQNDTFRRQSALQLVDAMMPFIDLGIVDPVALAENVLRSFGFKQLEGIIQQPAPMGEGAPPEGAPPEGMPPEGMPPEMAAAAPAGPLPLEEQSGVPADMEAAAIDIITQLPQDLLDMAHAQGLTDEFLVELFGQVIASGQDIEQFIEVMRARLSQPAMPAPTPM